MLGSVPTLVRPIGFHASRLLRSRGLEYVPDSLSIASNNNIEEYADSVSEFISKCIGDVVPTATITKFPNQKLYLWQHSSKTESANHCF